MQTIRKYRQAVLAECKVYIQIGDEGPYPGLVTAMAKLCAAVDPLRVPSRVRGRARTLRSILKVVYTKVKSCAGRDYEGVAKILQTEIMGVGGLSICKRLDAMCSKKSQKTQYNNSYSNRQSGGGGYNRNGRSRGRGFGGGRGRGGRGGPRNLADMQCHHCGEFGHLQNNCPQRNDAPAN